MTAPVSVSCKALAQTSLRDLQLNYRYFDWSDVTDISSHRTPSLTMEQCATLACTGRTRSKCKQAACTKKWVTVSKESLSTTEYYQLESHYRPQESYVLSCMKTPSQWLLDLFFLIEIGHKCRIIVWFMYRILLTKYNFSSTYQKKGFRLNFFWINCSGQWIDKWINNVKFFTVIR